MKVLITGASSGIGLSFAKYCNELGYNLILVTRNKEKLEELTKNFKVEKKIINIDLNNINDLNKLYLLTKDEDIDILINNAGFGLYGEFSKTNLTRELEMIDINIKAVHVLTKLYLNDMIKKNRGYILNVSSSAGFGSGPLMATYYATKSYVLHLSEAINYELKKENSEVFVATLCPGPVATNFNNIAGVTFNDKEISSDYVAKYAIDLLLKKRVIIIPTFKMKLVTFLRRIASRNFILKLTYNYQTKKSGKN